MGPKTLCNVGALSLCLKAVFSGAGPGADYLGVRSQMGKEKQYGSEPEREKGNGRGQQGISVWSILESVFGLYT